MEWLQTPLVAILSAAGTALISSILNRRKNDVELDDKINQMASRLLDEQREEIEALRGRLEIALGAEAKRQQETAALQRELQVVQVDLAAYRNEAEQLRRDNTTLQEKVEKYRRENNELKAKVDRLENFESGWKGLS